jgi:hypothetical protein
MRIHVRAAFVAAVVSSLALTVPSIGSAQQLALRTTDSLAPAARPAAWMRLGASSRSQATQTPARQGSAAFLNIGLDALTNFGWSSEPDVGSLQRGHHDPKVRGFTIPNVELTFEGAVDPYFKGFAALAYNIDGGETTVELEEAFGITTSLPWNLQVKAGQFFSDFGRHNTQHPHAWAFVDQPVPLGQMFGPDGLRGQGARLSWLAPTSVYAEAMVTTINASGETLFSFRNEESPEIHGGAFAETEVRSFKDMVVMPRLMTSIDVTETQTFVLGVSGAFGPNNTGQDARTAIYGADVYWKWKALTAQQGFPFLSFQAEVFSRRYDAAERDVADDPALTLPQETLKDWGAYSQVLWGIKPRFVAGIRAETMKGNTTAFESDIRNGRDRYSTNLSWFPSEFSKLRLQYNHDRRVGIGGDHSLWLQFEIIMGAHASHKF